MKDKELFNFLIERATKSIIEELRDSKYSNQDIKTALYKHIDKKVTTKRATRSHRIARPVMIISDSSDNE